MFKSRRENERVAALRAEVESLQSRLDADIANLDDGGDPACRQAMSDAAERSSSAGGMLGRARSAGEFEVARRTVIEGLTATRFVREKRGLPLGAELPSYGTARVDAPTTVTVDGDEHVAHPDYHPDRPHFFAGTAQAPAGYYRTPFWQKALAVGGAVMGAEMLGDAVGDLFGGGYSGNGGYDGGGFDGGGGDWS